MSDTAPDENPYRSPGETGGTVDPRTNDPLARWLVNALMFAAVVLVAAFGVPAIIEFIVFVVDLLVGID